MANEKTVPQVTMIIVGIVALVVGALGGYEARNMQVSQARSAYAGQYGGSGLGGGTSGNFPRGSGAGAARTGARGGAVVGQVVKVDPSSITVQLSDGSTHLVIITSNTNVSMATATTTSALATGQRVNVIGTANSDGSTSATTINITPGMPASSSPAAQ